MTSHRLHAEASPTLSERPLSEPRPMEFTIGGEQCTWERSTSKLYGNNTVICNIILHTRGKTVMEPSRGHEEVSSYAGYSYSKDGRVARAGRARARCEWSSGRRRRRTRTRSECPRRTKSPPAGPGAPGASCAGVVLWSSEGRGCWRFRAGRFGFPFERCVKFGSAGPKTYLEEEERGHASAGGQ